MPESSYLHVNDRRKCVLRHGDVLPKVLRLLPAGVLEAVEVVGTHVDAGVLRRRPVLLELGVAVVDALSRLDEAEGDPLRFQHVPVNVALIIGHVCPLYRIVLCVRHVRRLPAGAGEKDVQQARNPDRTRHDQYQKQQRHRPADDIFSVMFSFHLAMSPITIPRPSVQK